MLRHIQVYRQVVNVTVKTEFSLIHPLPESSQQKLLTSLLHTERSHDIR